MIICYMYGITEELLRLGLFIYISNPMSQLCKFTFDLTMKET